MINQSRCIVLYMTLVRDAHISVSGRKGTFATDDAASWDTLFFFYVQYISNLTFSFDVYNITWDLYFLLKHFKYLKAKFTAVASIKKKVVMPSGNINIYKTFYSVLRIYIFLRAYDDILLLSTHIHALTFSDMMMMSWKDIIVYQTTRVHHCPYLRFSTDIQQGIYVVSGTSIAAQMWRRSRYSVLRETSIIPWINPSDLYIINDSVAFMLCWSPFAWHRPLRPRGLGPVNHRNSAHCYTGRRETIALAQVYLIASNLNIENIIQTVPTYSMQVHRNSPHLHNRRYYFVQY